MEWTVPEKALNTLTVITSVCALGLLSLVAFDRFEARGGVPRMPVEVPDWEEYARVGHEVGPADADVTLIVFEDFQCPVCREFHPQLEWAQETFENDIRIVYRHWPLRQHPLAYEASRALECAADQGMYEDYRRLLLESTAWYAAGRPSFLEYARLVGITRIDDFRSCVSRVTKVPAIEADIAAAAKLGATGTPTLILNGWRRSATRDTAELGDLIRDQLRK